MEDGEVIIPLEIFKAHFKNLSKESYPNTAMPTGNQQTQTQTTIMQQSQPEFLHQYLMPTLSQRQVRLKQKWQACFLMG
jgi:hypothetical protein